MQSVDVHFKMWIKAMREHFLDLEITDSLLEDHIAWRASIYVANHNNVGVSYDDDLYSGMT